MSTGSVSSDSEFNTDLRKKIRGIAMPWLKISFVFGDDFRGIKIRL